jgi:hypothetical protein
MHHPQNTFGAALSGTLPTNITCYFHNCSTVSEGSVLLKLIHPVRLCHGRIRSPGG